MQTDKSGTVKIAAVLLALNALVFIFNGLLLIFGNQFQAQALGILYFLLGLAAALGTYWLWKMKRHGAAIGIAIPIISIAAAIIASAGQSGLLRRHSIWLLSR